jgi:hypothetical protein
MAVEMLLGPTNPFPIQSWRSTYLQAFFRKAPAPITSFVQVFLPADATAALLMLAELYQRTDQSEKAIGLLENLVDAAPHPAFALSLGELFFQAEMWEELATLPSAFDNTDDLSAEALCL